MVLQSPKRVAASQRNSVDWYDYYAGYAPQYVRDVLTGLNLPSGAIIMDPWNGSGTTTHVAGEMGLSSIGYDANPAMVVVAKGRLLDTGVENSLQSLSKDILKKAHRSRWMRDTGTNEPLACWLSPDSARYFRAIERAIQTLLVNECQDLHDQPIDVSRLSTLACFYYTALFQYLRQK